MPTDTPPNPPEGFDPVAAEKLSRPLQLLGARISAWSAGRAELRAEVTPDFLNRHGLIHGGAHMIILDTAAGLAPCYCPYPGRYRRVVTVSLTTTFLAAASSGLLIAEGRVVGGGRKTVFSDASITDGDGRLLARASGVFRYLGAGSDEYGEPRPEA